MRATSPNPYQAREVNRQNDFLSEKFPFPFLRPQNEVLRLDCGFPSLHQMGAPKGLFASRNVVAWQHEFQTRQGVSAERAGDPLRSVQGAFARVGRGFMLDCSQFVSNYDVAARKQTTAG
jgi:hypothetical protein